ncbi:MAG: nucleotidyltransferase substrate binding protein [Alphaproteobacteria bacterium]|nr:nucleotidyltransferase substrate binding protein [Alphaproteobacteria bacterium]
MALDLTSFENAVQRLRDGLARHDREPDDEQLRDGLIQRFEFTYELAHKMLRRWLRAQSASPDDIAALSFADLIRVGNAQGVLAAEWTAWRRFREMRTRTSHTYDAKAAQDVAASVPAFLKEVEHLLTELRRRPV